eukprot:CAMPEP_0117544000 /NCGR_PEP_ID=MMETSP0784-20121206/45346_1 /TAXON_ID=39447 /ORGANISM="" /LENGTH=66 /DNA_ID=CAMNT_0005340787 /DNA_START=4 /DNA_END=201 /DNA_ORIENTATION=+
MATMARSLCFVVAAFFGLAGAASAQQVRGSVEVTKVAFQQLGEFDNKAEPTHSPPNWNVDPPMSPI